jgi:hypothetical protein
MKGYIAALSLSLLLGVAGAASATTAVIDFNDPSKSSANTLLVTSEANGKTTSVNVGGRKAVQTGGTSDNQFLYVALPKDLFKNSKTVWGVVEYYDQGTDTFTIHYTDTGGADTIIQAYGADAKVTKHDTKAWSTFSVQLTGFGFTEAGPGGADVWIDDLGDGPEIIDKIIVTDQDPDLTHMPHVDPAHPIKIDGVFDKDEWDGAYTVTLNTAAQDACSSGANWTGPDDFSAIYYHKWDESGLYVRGDVIDATPRLNDQTGNAAWNGDGFEEFIALDWSNPAHTSYLPGTDFHVFLGLGDTPMWGIQAIDAGGAVGDAAFDNDKGAIPTQNLAIKNTAKGYQFELYLPWKFLLDEVKNTKTVVTAGQQIGWFMFANNSKEIGPSSQCSGVAMTPFKRTGPSGNPSKWSTIVLDSVQQVTNPTAGQ